MGYLGQLQEYKKELINEESGDAPVKEMAQPHVRAQCYVCPTMFPAEKRAMHQSWQHTILSHIPRVFEYMVYLSTYNCTDSVNTNNIWH